MWISSLVACWVLAGWGGPDSEPDNRIVVVAETAPLSRGGTEAVAHASRGTIFTPAKLEPDWAWVKYHDGKSAVEGWVYRKHALSLDDALLATTLALRKASDASLLALRGTIWYAVGDDERAIEDLVAATRLDGSKPEAWATLGAARTRQGDPVRALADLDEAVRLDPGYTPARKARAIARAATGRYASAISDLDEVLGRNPGDVAASRMRAILREARGEPRKAAEELDQILRSRPDDAEARRERAQALARLGRYDQAAADLVEACRLAPDDPAPHDALAWLRATCPDASVRDGARAVESASRACELTGWTDPARIATLAAANAEARRFDEAAKWQLKSIEVGGKDDLAESRLQLYKSGQPYRQAVVDEEAPSAERPDRPVPASGTENSGAEDQASEAERRRADQERKARADRGAKLRSRRDLLAGKVRDIEAAEAKQRRAEQDRVEAEKAEQDRQRAEAEMRDRRTPTGKQTDTFGAVAVPAQGGGMFITESHVGTPAARIGLEYGDVIHSINGYAVNTEAEYFWAVRNSPDVMKLVIRNVRTGGYDTFDVTLDR